MPSGASTNDVVSGSEKEGRKHIASGPKLWLVTAAVTLVMFLTLLDTTIIVTVYFDPIQLIILLLTDPL